MIPFFLFILVGLMVLLPPLSFLRAARRFVDRSLTPLPFWQKAALAILALAPLFINITYMVLAAPNFATGQLEPDAPMGIAVIISWLTFWGRVNLGRRTPKLQPRPQAAE